MVVICTVFVYLVSFFYLTVLIACMICFYYVCDCHAFITGNLLTYFVSDIIIHITGVSCVYSVSTARVLASQAEAIVDLGGTWPQHRIDIH